MRRIIEILVAVAVALLCIFWQPAMPKVGPDPNVPPPVDTKQAETAVEELHERVQVQENLQQQIGHMVREKVK